uniref:Uncharacterized protein n=1 Tax=Daphnia magna TaxID=35525 RepID=A0A0P6H0E2_9CRUS
MKRATHSETRQIGSHYKASRTLGDIIQSREAVAHQSAQTPYVNNSASFQFKVTYTYIYDGFRNATSPGVG